MSESEEEIGVVTHYFNHIKVGAIRLTSGSLHVGDTIHVKGHTADFNMSIDSMQIDHDKVEEASTGDVVGVSVPDRVHEHDKVFKVS